MNANARLPRWLGPVMLGASAGLLVATVTCCLGADAPRQPAPVASTQPADALVALEQAYWTCDYFVSRSIMSIDEAAVCSHVFEELKDRKFAGDFQAMMGWWRDNRVAAHQAVAASAHPVALPRPDR